MQKIGELLTKNGLVTQQQLNNALKIQANEKAMIGKIMVAENYLRQQDLQKTLAQKHNLPFVELNVQEPDFSLLKPELQHQYFALEIIPLKQNNNEVTLAVTNISAEVLQWTAINYAGCKVTYAITSSFDILWSLQKHFAKNDDEAARLALLKQSPEFSARKLISLPVKLLMIAIIAALEGAFYVQPQQSFVYFGWFVNVMCLASVLYKTVFYFMGRNRRKQHILPNENLPIYTVLVPLFREEKSIPRLLKCLQNLDYPKTKLDIKLVVEAADDITINAIKKAAPPQYMEIIKVPYSLPQTKPKACNYALLYARGEFVTIFDAEDDPDPTQLKKALAEFMQVGKELACVQAKLNYYNTEKNLLTRWFALEYATWFEAVMNGVELSNSPLPLGGTSNHIRVDVLKKLGGWDAFNVTEDADLGLRLAQFGYKIATINSVTMEEAPAKIMPWLKQRTRWLKGFLQTYFVHMRAPLKLIKNTGIQGFLILQFFFALPVLLLMLMPFWVVFAASLEIPPMLNNFAFANFIFCTLIHIFMGYDVQKNLRDYEGEKLFKAFPLFPILTMPVYWLLHLAASYMAVYQLITKPHYWNKTEHGQ